jgi:hypothetical protein
VDSTKPFAQSVDNGQVKEAGSILFLNLKNDCFLFLVADKMVAKRYTNGSTRRVS